MSNGLMILHEESPYLIHTTHWVASVGNTTYTPTTLTKEEILYNHMYVFCSFGIWTKDEVLDLPSLLDSKITQLS
jgi:hypothetical protein